MVTLLSPNQNKLDATGAEPASAPTMLVDYDETSAARPAEEVADPQTSTKVDSISRISQKNFWTSIASPLAGFWDLLTGPPMTEQERRRQTLAEARARNTAALSWFYGMPF
jgi:hypothetical protein